MTSSGTQKRAGRPATGQGVQVQVRLQPDTLARIDQYAEAKGWTRPQVIRAMIEAVEKTGGLEA